ncbi:hypothetical protein EYC84_002567 [Monilinia fructicola]|uniref:Uncharacterized protein n=1 Tax=Monilinia fructicola TaxID=38448 RepID=A0A5M9JTS0_MONFR|nr:hypothetical protein EYC84_002567 [Monilinia fructicola]
MDEGREERREECTTNCGKYSGPGTRIFAWMTMVTMMRDRGWLAFSHGSIDSVPWGPGKASFTLSTLDWSFGNDGLLKVRKEVVFYNRVEKQSIASGIPSSNTTAGVCIEYWNRGMILVQRCEETGSFQYCQPRFNTIYQPILL